MPGFSFESLPYILCSDSYGITILNLENGFQDKLIFEKSQSASGQIEFFAIQHDYGFCLHFTFGRKLDNGTLRLEWVRMPLKNDLLHLLSLNALGELPASEMSKKFAALIA